MPNFRNLVKLTFALLALWLGLVWMKVFPRPGFLRPEMDIEPLTYVLGILAASLLAFWKTSDSDSESISSSTAEDDSIYAEIRHYLAVRYAHRVDSKLAGRFPVNLRILSSDAGTSEEGKAKLITVQDEQVGHQIGEIFDQAHGRLLVVGM